MLKHSVKPTKPTLPTLYQSTNLIYLIHILFFLFEQTHQHIFEAAHTENDSKRYQFTVFTLLVSLGLDGFTPHLAVPL